MDNENWIVGSIDIDEHTRIICETNSDFTRLTRLFEHGVLGYTDYRNAVLSNANKLIKYLKEERRPASD